MSSKILHIAKFGGLALSLALLFSACSSKSDIDKTPDEPGTSKEVKSKSEAKSQRNSNDDMSYTNSKSANRDTHLHGERNTHPSYSDEGDTYVKDREVKFDIGRDLTITKSGPYIRYPRFPQYEPKMLNEGAKGIAIANSVPYTCILLGEVEGRDSSDGRAAPSFEEIREGTLNDLRNHATELVYNDSRILVSLTKEAMTCEMMLDDGKFEERDCTSWSVIPNNGRILSYRIHANVFECPGK